MSAAHGVEYSHFAFDMFAAANLADQRRIRLAHRANGFEFLAAIEAEVFVNGHNPLQNNVSARKRSD